MSQRNSDYARVERDLYETPEWVTEALLPHLPARMVVWEPACGSGKMVRALEAGGHRVFGTDIAGGDDFLAQKAGGYEAIITNPPYTHATQFVEHALAVTRPEGTIAMLLRTDFDHAKTRAHLFADCPAFAKKLVLTRRIVWFDRPGAAPSFNHAWYIWDWTHSGPPVLAYGPAEHRQKETA